jgi:hypothetical protein
MNDQEPVALSGCAREPTHVPGFTQEFGVLLAVPVGEERISQISSNTEIIFGAAPTEPVGQKIATVLGEKNALAIKDVFNSGNWKETNPIKISIEQDGTAFSLNVIVHRYDGLDFIEIEAVSKEGEGLRPTHTIWFKVPFFVCRNPGTSQTCGTPWCLKSTASPDTTGLWCISLTATIMDLSLQSRTESTSNRFWGCITPQAISPTRRVAFIVPIGSDISRTFITVRSL